MTTPDLTINYINGYCGAGKTYAIARYAKQLRDLGRKIVIVQPTTQLIGETIGKTFPDVGIAPGTYTAISGDTHAYAVVSTLRKHLDASGDEGEILVITHSAFFALSYWPRRHKWTVIFDEVPHVTNEFKFNLPDTHGLITDHLELGAAENTHYHQLTAKAGSSTLQTYADNSRDDDIIRSLSGFAKHVISPHWGVYVLAANYHRLIGNVDDDDVSAKQLVAFGILSPIVFSGFAKVYVAAACFVDSLLYHLWSSYKGINIQFVDATASFTLRYAQHDNGDLVDIYYATTANWSKRARDTVLDDGATLGEAITRKAADLIQGGAWAFLANSDVDAMPFELGERLPNVSHGLNTYQHIDHFVSTAAYNPDPAHFRFLRLFADVDAEAVQTAITRAATYQALCRTSIRDQGSRTRKRWIVPDETTAQWLAGIFEGAVVHDLGIVGTGKGPRAGRPKVHRDNADRCRAHRQRKAKRDAVRAQRLVRAALVRGDAISATDYPIALDVREAMAVEVQNAAIARRRIDPAASQGSFFALRTSTTGVDAEGSFDDLASIYRAYASETFGSKHLCPAYSPAVYVANEDAETSRGYDNIAWTRNIALDVDDGTLSPAEFAALFPAWRMMVHSSWSHTAARPKWRAIIATDAVVDVAGYKVITAHIVASLAEHGWYSPKALADDPGLATRRGYKGVHGLDASKLNPACVLYVPSQGAFPAEQFFYDFNSPERAPVDVDAVLVEATVPDEDEHEQKLGPVVPVVPARIRSHPNASPALRALQRALEAEQQASYAAAKGERIREAVDEFSSSGSLPGNRDAGVFTLVRQLHRAGCTATEINEHASQAIRGTCSGSLRSELVSKMKRAAKKVAA